MPRHVRTFFALATALVTAAVLAPAASAIQGTTADSVTCQFNGLAGSLVPPIPAMLNDPDLAASIETGIYHLNAGATCVRVDNDPGEAANSGVFNVEMISDGQYANGVCGVTDFFEVTDRANTRLTSPDPRWEGPLEFAYVIRDVGSHGVMQITNAALVGETARSTGTGQGDGYALVVPTSGNCVTSNVAYFEFHGAFSIAV